MSLIFVGKTIKLSQLWQKLKGVVLFFKVQLLTNYTKLALGFRDKKHKKLDFKGSSKRTPTTQHPGLRKLQAHLDTRIIPPSLPFSCTTRTDKSTLCANALLSRFIFNSFRELIFHFPDTHNSSSCLQLDFITSINNLSRLYSAVTPWWPHSLVPGPSGCNEWAAGLPCIASSNHWPHLPLNTQLEMIRLPQQQM